MSSLSLVMIVRDERELLKSFLAHHSGLVDEIVVVDTGSQDDSVAVAEAAGARSLVCSWNQDFADARNRGLDSATGEWILILDADELVSPADFAELRAVTDAAPDRVYLQRTINYLPDARHLEWQPVSGADPQMESGQTGFFEARRVGLFPAHGDLRFRGRIHESILPDAEAAGFRMLDHSVPVHHYGYVLSSERNSSRNRRDLELAHTKLKETPDDWPAMLELASLQLESGQIEEARARLVELSHGPDRLRPVVRGRVLLARLLQDEGNQAAAEQLYEQAVEGDPGFLFGWLGTIRLRAEQGQWSRVEEALRAARPLFRSGEPLLEREALRCYVKTGRIAEAARCAAELADRCPSWSEMVNLAARLNASR